MKERFRELNMSGNIDIKLTETRRWTCSKHELITAVSAIVVKYESEGYNMTLRQIYYQLVAADMIPNHDKVYKKLGSVVNDARYMGLIDWQTVEDRGRRPITPYFEESLAGSLARTLSSYTLDRRIGQPYYIELWSEKDAISNILTGAVRNYSITTRINKGFASATSIYNSYKVFAEELLDGKPVVILYFGDHDPSGLDMVRDIKERLELMLAEGRYRAGFFQAAGSLIRSSGSEFVLWHKDLKAKWLKISGKDKSSEEYRKMMIDITVRAYVRKMVTVKHIGLTKEQVEKYDLPPNPAKITDPRASRYIERHGQSSWEVDALSPSIIEGIIRDEISNYMDWNAYNKMLNKEVSDKDELTKIIKKYQDG